MTSSASPQALQDGIAVPLSPSRWLGRHIQDLLSKLQSGCVVPSAMQPLQRRPSVAADVAPVHQVRSIFHQRAQHPCVGRDFGSCAMLQRSFQCSGLTGHESYRTFDDPVGLTFSHWRPSGTVWFHSWRACPISLVNASIAGSLSHLSVTLLSKLINESRCSLCDPGELRSLSQNHHCPRHLESPLVDDCLQETRGPLTRAALHPSRLEHPTSCVVRSRLGPSHRTCTMICTVDEWSCAVGVRGQSVDLGRECSLPVHSCRQIPSLHPRLHRPSHRSTRHCSRPLSHSAHTVTFTLFSRSSNCGLTAPIRLDFSSTLTLPAVKKLSCCN